MFNFLRKIISDTNPLRLLYHKLVAVVAAMYYRFPGRKMTVIGITGTNGKTTTVNLTAKILETAGYKVGLSSTINFQVGDKKWTNITKQTTQSPFVLQKLLREMVSAGCKFAVVEVSSHAMTQSRVWGINIDCAAYTNVTEDHIEYHGSFANYLNAKGALFKKVSKSSRKPNVPKTMILNQEDPHYSYFDQFIADRKLTYGLKEGTLSTLDLKLKPDGTQFTLRVPNGAVPIDFDLPGDFNVQNALCAASICMAYGISVDDIKRGLEAARTVPGRYDHVDAGQDFSIVVDYAHATDSLEKLLSMYQDLTPNGKVYAVFGATGGGRDKAKRPKMGAVADKYADYIIVTDDDPYSDDELQIIDEVSAGINRKEGDRFWKIVDRREAIRLALMLAKKGDSLVVAGKGAEEVMKVRGQTIPWNDKNVIVELLRRQISVGEVK
jgi:UDP-N-acetylmuramoyl-L-alanyl-D-glutamate--2,6-diaminopimelate ligase